MIAYGGFAGWPLNPSLKVGDVLIVQWWDGIDLQTSIVDVVDGDDQPTDLPWDLIETWEYFSG